MYIYMYITTLLPITAEYDASVLASHHHATVHSHTLKPCFRFCNEAASIGHDVVPTGCHCTDGLGVSGGAGLLSN